MFSLCIPTLDRFDEFLINYLPNYLQNELIDEVIITDENGNDVQKINQTFGNIKKLKLFINETKLGPFLNKLNACKKATNEWIVLIDSDNFADKQYFKIANDYIINNIKNQKNVILAPCKALPNFNYSHLSGFIYKKGDFAKNRQNETLMKQNYNSPSNVCMNTGNYIINKFLIHNLNLQKETENIKKSSACDVIYFNTLLFEQLDLNMHIVKDLEYHHVVHNGSVYIQTCNKFNNFNQTVYSRYNNLI
jgi:hypothetical protein